MRLLTYNLWHGIAPAGRWRFRSLEPRARREERELLQLQLVRSQAADVTLLQEVNPLAARRRLWEDRLGMTAFAQPDLTGFKWRGYGWPHNLGSGLVTLVNRSWRPRL